MRPEPPRRLPKKKRLSGLPLLSMIVLALILAGCALAPWMSTRQPNFLDLANYSQAPSGKFLFGTDTLGRDIFTCIWYGGRISIFIGFVAALITTGIAVLYGTLCGMVSARAETRLLHLTDLLLSVPNLLLIIFLQAIVGRATPLSIAVSVGLTGWFTMAKIIRTEVRRLRASDYVVAARCMGAGFFHLLRVHLLPNFIASTMFMVVMTVRTAIVAESTLSFMGIGLPVDTVSWGSMLSLADQAMLTNAWWMILIPGIFLVALLMALTAIGQWLQLRLGHRSRML